VENSLLEKNVGQRYLSLTGAKMRPQKKECPGRNSIINSRTEAIWGQCGRGISEIDFQDKGRRIKRKWGKNLSEGRRGGRA